MELEHFRDVLNGKEEPFINVVDACRATQVAEACRLSIEHEKPVYIKYNEKSPGTCVYSFENPNATL